MLPIEYGPNPAKIVIPVPVMICECFIAHGKEKDNMTVKSLKVRRGLRLAVPTAFRSAGILTCKYCSPH